LKNKSKKKSIRKFKMPPKKFKNRFIPDRKTDQSATNNCEIPKPKNV